MRYVDEFRDPALCQALLRRIETLMLAIPQSQPNQMLVRMTLREHRRGPKSWNADHL